MYCNVIVRMIVTLLLLPFTTAIFAQQARPQRDPQTQQAYALARATMGEYMEDGSMGIIVDQQEVRDALRYSTEQFDSLEIIKDETDQKVSAMRDRFKDIVLLPESLQKRAAEQLRNELIPEVERLRDETRRKMEGIIGSKMTAQSKTLVFQAAGGLQAPTVSTDNFLAFDLSESQKQQIREIARISREEYQAITAGVDVRDPRQLAQVTPKIDQLRQRNNQRIRAVLTADQLKLAEALTEDGRPLFEAIRTRATAPRTGARPAVEPQPAGEPWMPGPDSWKPGDPVPKKSDEPRVPSVFPTS